jgi:hypothetical protein
VFLFVLALAFCSQIAAAQESSLRLALIYPPEAAPLGDLLTAELGKEQGISLLEREQIRRIFEEKALNAAQANQDPARVGALLGAEGLIILEASGGAGKASRSVSFRMIWAERGIVLHETVLPYSEKEVAKAVDNALPQIKQALRKLGELRTAGKSAVAMHIKGVYADSGGEVDLRQGLGLLFSQRIQHETGWVVVDRRNLTDATFENEQAQGKGDQKLVAATHRLTLGFAKEGAVLKFRGQLEMPGGEPKPFAFSGKFEEPVALADAMMMELRKAMGVGENVNAAPWDPNKEAQELFNWANQEFSARSSKCREAYEAGSASWALGLRKPEVALLRAILLSRWAWTEQRSRNERQDCPLIDDKDAVRRMLQAMELWQDYCRAFPGADVEMSGYISNSLQHLEIDDILGNAGELLKAIYADGLGTQYSDDLPRLRRALREAVDELPGIKWGKVKERDWMEKRIALVIRFSGLWEEDYAAAQKRIGNALLTFNRNDYRSGALTFEEIEHDLRMGERNWKSERLTFLYPKCKADEAECRLRGLEIIQQLENSHKDDPSLFATALKWNLGLYRFGVPSAKEDLDSAKYLGLTAEEVMPDLVPGDPYKWLSTTKKLELFFRTLAVRKPDQLLKRGVLQGFTHFSSPDLSSEDALRVAQALDFYWSEAERDVPLMKNPETNNEKTPFATGRASNEYIGCIARVLNDIRMVHPNVDDWMQKRYPDRRLPDNAFPVRRLWFSRHWKSIAPLNLSCLGNHESPRVATDGRNLFINSYRGVWDEITGMWMVAPPQMQVQKVYMGPDLDITIASNVASDGWIFFMTPQESITPDGPRLYAAKAGREPVIHKMKGDLRNVEGVAGFVPPCAYVTVNGNAQGKAKRIYRWNLEKNTMDLIADGARTPPANPLDRCLGMGIYSWLLVTKLPNGDDGLLLSYYDKTDNFSVFSVTSQSTTPSLLGDYNPNTPAQTPWAAAFLKKISGSPTKLKVIANKNTFNLLESNYYLSSRLLLSKPKAASFNKLFPDNPYQLDSNFFETPLIYSDFYNPVNRTTGRSVSCFSVGDIRGAVLIEQLMGREKFAAVWLVFFEPDGIKYVSLRFEPTPDELEELKRYQQDAKTRYELDRWMIHAQTARPDYASDKAWGLKDALVISVVKINALWFLTREEVMEARKLARKIE